MTTTLKSASGTATPTADEFEPQAPAAEVTEISEVPDVSEDALWRRAAWGLAWGFIIAGLMAYGLMELTQADESFASKLGLSLYVAFWSGPFIGLSGAVGFHELQKNKARRATDTGSRTAGQRP